MLALLIALSWPGLLDGTRCQRVIMILLFFIYFLFYIYIYILFFYLFCCNKTVLYPFFSGRVRYVQSFSDFLLCGFFGHVSGLQCSYIFLQNCLLKLLCGHVCQSVLTAF